MLPLMHDVLLKYHVDDEMYLTRKRVRAENAEFAVAYAKDDLKVSLGIPIDIKVLSVQSAKDMDYANALHGLRQTKPVDMMALEEMVHSLSVAQRTLLRVILRRLEAPDAEDLTPA